jgi:hypothetical protein
MGYLTFSIEWNDCVRARRFPAQGPGVAYDGLLRKVSVFVRRVLWLCRWSAQPLRRKGSQLQTGTKNLLKERTESGMIFDPVGE